jgi:hypothetical protein
VTATSHSSTPPVTSSFCAGGIHERRLSARRLLSGSTAAAPKSLRPWLVKGPGSRKRERETELFTGCYQRPGPEVSREANGRSTRTKRGLGVRGLSWAAPAMTAIAVTNSRAVMRSGFCAESAIRNPQIAEVNFCEWTGESRPGMFCWRSSRKASHSAAVIMRCWCDSFMERPVYF